MKAITIKKASWQDPKSVYSKERIVLEQDGFFFEPSDRKFIDALFVEYVTKYMKKDSAVLDLNIKELNHLEKNAVVYKLNHMYNDLFIDRSKAAKNPFNLVLSDKKGDDDDCKMFYLALDFEAPYDSGMRGLIDIIEKMQIDFEELQKNYKARGFPDSRGIHIHKKDKDVVKYKDY